MVVVVVGRVGVILSHESGSTVIRHHGARALGILNGVGVVVVCGAAITGVKVGATATTVDVIEASVTIVVVTIVTLDNASSHEYAIRPLALSC